MPPERPITCHPDTDVALHSLNDEDALEIDADDAREIEERLQLLAGICLQLPLNHAPEPPRREPYAAALTDIEMGVMPTPH